MTQIVAQWLRGLDLEMVLTRDLSLVAQWLGSILAHEDKIKKIYPTNIIIFFFFLLVNAIFFLEHLHIKEKKNEY